MTKDSLNSQGFDVTQTLFAIDTSIYIFQSYFGFPDRFFSRSGRSINAVYGYTLWLLKFLQDVKPRYISACFDESLLTGFRHEIDPNYKSNRALPDEELSYQLLACKKITSLLGIPCHASQEYEADDFIASSVSLAQHFDLNSCIVSKDKDLAQLLILEDKILEEENTVVLAEMNLAETLNTQVDRRSMWHYPHEEKINALAFYKKHHINPALMADFLAIVGDSADAITGVPGVGPKTVTQLFQHFPGWNSLKRNIDSISDLPLRGAARVQSLIQDNAELIDKNLKLTTLVNTIFCKENPTSSLNTRSSLNKGIDDSTGSNVFTRLEVDKDALSCLFDEFNFPKKMYRDLEL